MKPNDVNRSVKSQRFDRSAGDAPSLGRVGRMPGTGIPKGARRIRKRADRGDRGGGNRARINRSRMVMAWSAIMLLIVVGGIGMALKLWLKTSGDRKRAGDEEVILERRIASEFPSPSEDEALSLVKRAVALKNPADVKDYFRLGDTDAGKVTKFLQEMEKNDGELTGYNWLSSMDVNGMLLDGVLISTNHDGKVKNRLALLTPDEKGVWKIDFDAFARTVEPSWEEIVGGRADEALVRVIVARDSYFNAAFSDDTKWESFGMASPDHDGVLLGYAATGSPQAQALGRILAEENAQEGSKPMRRVTLKLKRVEGADTRQFEIVRVLAEDWALADAPLDGGAP